jgi:hypothetical protein
MFLELIAVFVGGIAAAGMVLLLNRLVGGRLPKWLMPIAAGAAMLGVTISSEIGWYGRTVAALPAGIEVAQVVEERAFYRPWTYVTPYISRFVALNRSTLRRHAEQPDLRIAEMLFYGRWAPLHRVQVAIDCKAGRRAELIDGVSFGADGAVLGADWADVGGDDPLVAAVCRDA